MQASTKAQAQRTFSIRTTKRVNAVTLAEIILALHFGKARGGAAEGIGGHARRIKLVGRARRRSRSA